MSTIDRGTVGNRMAIERISKIKSHLIFRNGCTLNKIKATEGFLEQIVGEAE